MRRLRPLSLSLSRSLSFFLLLSPGPGGRPAFGSAFGSLFICDRPRRPQVWEHGLEVDFVLTRYSDRVDLSQNLTTLHYARYFWSFLTESCDSVSCPISSAIDPESTGLFSSSLIEHLLFLCRRRRLFLLYFFLLEMEAATDGLLPCFRLFGGFKVQTLSGSRPRIHLGPH